MLHFLIRLIANSLLSSVVLANRIFILDNRILHFLYKSNYTSKRNEMRELDCIYTHTILHD